MKILFSFLATFIVSSNSFAWETATQNSQYGPINIAWKRSTTDPSVSLLVVCVQNQKNATISISTDNLVVGLANHTEELIYSVGKGNAEGKGSGPSLIHARIREDGMGFYLGEGQQGLSMRAMIANNDWMKVYWNFVEPNRGKILNDILGKPNAKPQRSYTFDISGYLLASQRFVTLCG